MSEELFTMKMKRATRKAHALSDALVNAKLLFALNNNNVWAEGLLVFYEVFKFLEKAMEIKKEENLGKLYIAEMSRTLAFETDLEFYLGKNWKSQYKVRSSVKNYLSHLEDLFHNDSDLLMAYVYHLYMGLLSGGQILRKKRELQRKVMTCEANLGQAVTNFKNTTISDLKSSLKNKMNEISEHLDEEKRNKLIEESVKVFEYNNSIIRTVKGTSAVAFKNISIIVSIIVLFLAILFFFFF